MDPPLLPHVGKCSPSTPEYFKVPHYQVFEQIKGASIRRILMRMNCKSMCLLVLELGNQSSNIGLQRNTELVTFLDELRRRLLSCPDTGRSAGDNDSAGGQGCALGKEADELRDGEDHVAVRMLVDSLDRLRQGSLT